MFVVNFPALPSPGDIISVPKFVVLRHKGIVTGRYVNGRPTVVSNSARSGVVEETFDQFVAGQPWVNEGYPGHLPAYEVLHRAQLLSGRPYDLFAWNCENFVYACHGLPAKSPQVAGALIVAVLATVAFARV